MRTYVVPLLLAPAAAVALWWAAAAISTPGTNSEWLVVVAFLPLLAALIWMSVRRRSVAHTVVIGVAMVLSTLVVWYLTLMALLLIASLNCPDDAHECPI